MTALLRYRAAWLATGRSFAKASVDLLRDENEKTNEMVGGLKNEPLQKPYTLLQYTFDIQIRVQTRISQYLVWYGMVWYGMVWYGMVWYGIVWYSMVWYGIVWYGMVWYGMV